MQLHIPTAICQNVGTKKVCATSEVQPYDGTIEQETFGIPEAKPCQTSYYYTRNILFVTVTIILAWLTGHLLSYNSSVICEDSSEGVSMTMTAANRSNSPGDHHLKEQISN
jgi:hypothetical protein